MTWQRGETGNPFGRRPKVNLFRTICQEYSREAFEHLKEMIENPLTHSAVKFQALKFVLESAWGRARQSIEIKMDEVISPAMMTTEQLKLAAAGQTEELVCNLMATGKLEEYTRRYDGAVLSDKKEVIDMQKVLDDATEGVKEVKSRKRK